MRNKMGTLEVKGETLTCLYGAKWPPAEIEAYGSIAVASQYLTDPEILRLETYEKVCGLKEMSPDKCLKCPYVVRDGVANMYRGRSKVRQNAAGRGNQPRLPVTNDASRLKKRAEKKR